MSQPAPDFARPLGVDPEAALRTAPPTVHYARESSRPLIVAFALGVLTAVSATPLVLRAADLPGALEFMRAARDGAQALALFAGLVIVLCIGTRMGRAVDRVSSSVSTIDSLVRERTAQNQDGTRTQRVK